MFKVEKNVTVPRHGAGRKNEYAQFLETLEIGDSYFIPDSPEIAKLRQYPTGWGRGVEGGPRRFKSRRVPGGVRVWRSE